MEKINPFLRQHQLPVPFLVIAHRGARAYAPENTLPAFEKSVEMGAHVIEFDVHLTKDHVPIVAHDDTLRRCSDVKIKYPDSKNTSVSSFTWEQISQLDAGSWYASELCKPPKQRAKFLRHLTAKERREYITQEEMERYSSGKVRFSTLEEILLFSQQHKFYLNIELKQIPRFYKDMAGIVVQQIRKFDMAHRVLISSFDHYEVVEIKNTAPEIATAILCCDRIYNPGEYCAQVVNADVYHPCCAGKHDSLGFPSAVYRETGILRSDAIQNALSTQTKINVWTVNKSDHMKKLVNMGIHGIITDYPNRLVDVLQDKYQPLP